MNNVEEIIKRALSFVGQKEKGANNSGFENEWFEEELGSVGWAQGQNWCGYMMMLVLKGMIDDEKYKLLSPSVNSTYMNFKSKFHKSIVKIPEEGRLVIYQLYENGNPTWKGHIGIVTEIIDDLHFMSLEGNGNAKGGSRGEEVVNIERRVDFSPKKNGLILRCFIDLFV